MTAHIESADALLASLRWDEDMLVTNHFGERVWLKPCFDGATRIGITDCCHAADPCDWHRAMRSAARSGDVQ